MLEKTVERQLVKAVRKMGGRAVKFVSPSLDGMPDRLVLLPKGKICFVEVKAPGKKPRPLQQVRLEMLRDLGFSVHVLDSIGMIGEILDDLHTS